MILSPSKFKLWSGTCSKIQGSNPRQGRSKFFVPFSFHFHILLKNRILTHKISSFTNWLSMKINYILLLCNLLIYKKKDSICFDIQFFTDKMKKVKKKKKNGKMAKNLTFPHWDSNPDFWTKLSPPRFEFWGRLDQ